MIGLRRACVALPIGVLLALAACDIALGLGDLKDRVADGSVAAPPFGETDGATPETSDGGRGDGSVPIATSCQSATGPGLTDCGPTANESCCTTLKVEGGEFARDNVATYPATVSSFYLDRFEVTVGRFRAFVDAFIGGFRPAPGSGIHAHLNGGRGLALVSGGYELGWKSEWIDKFPTSRADWTGELSCQNSKYQTWTDALDAGGASNARDARPATCMSWYEAYAFCIWDGGFLPTEAEWNYAAIGGADQRKYPWSNPPSSTLLDCSFANFGGLFWPSSSSCSDAGPTKVGLLSPTGDGKWRQADLGGNVYEWTMDEYASPYTNPCVDCLHTDGSNSRVYRGGAFSSADGNVSGASRHTTLAVWGGESVGMRCARSL